MAQVGYLSFEVDVAASEKRKTEVVSVYSLSSHALLGQIKWFSRWRQFVFCPAFGTVFNPDCLEAIAGKAADMTAEHRRRRAA